MEFTTTLPRNGDPPKVLFSWIDYLFCCIMLGISAVIGIYYAFWGNKERPTNNDSAEAKTMSVFPVAMSLIASYTSATVLLAVPADVYIFGASGVWTCMAIVISSLINVYIFLPVFSKLQCRSIYEYLQLRFDNRIRLLASFLCALSEILFNPIVIYLPSIAFSQVSGVSLNLIAPILGIICIFYTTIGELKAVIWTDTVQTLAIVLSLVAVVIVGIISTGGFSNIWTKSAARNHLDMFNFSVDLTRRNSALVITIGYTVLMMQYTFLNQGCFQRYTTLPSIHHAKRAIVIFFIGIMGVNIFVTFIGLAMFARYSECDPILTKQVIQSDQVVSYYVLDAAGDIPCLPGLFISGVISAGLSTLSTVLNSLSCTIYEDFISPFMSPNVTQKKRRNIMKLTIVVIGTISTALVFVIEHLGGVLPLIFSIGGITSGPLVGLFCLGILVPCANSKGALIGGIAGLLFSFWMIIGNQFYEQMDLLEDFSKPSSTDGCNFYVNTSRFAASPSETVFVLYRITFWCYTLLGASVVMITGIVVSVCTSKNHISVNPNLVSPIVHILLPKRRITISLPTPCEYIQEETPLNLTEQDSA